MLRVGFEPAISVFDRSDYTHINTARSLYYRQD